MRYRLRVVCAGTIRSAGTSTTTKMISNKNPVAWSLSPLLRPGVMMLIRSLTRESGRMSATTTPGSSWNHCCWGEGKRWRIQACKIRSGDAFERFESGDIGTTKILKMVYRCGEEEANTSRKGWLWLGSSIDGSMFRLRRTPIADTISSRIRKKRYRVHKHNAKDVLWAQRAAVCRFN